MPATEPTRWRDRLARALAVVRTIIGVPDYERYVAHCARHHPDRPVPSREEFLRRRLEERYRRPGARCC